MSVRKVRRPASLSEVRRAIAGLQHIFGSSVSMACVLVALAAAVGPALVRAPVVEEESVGVVFAAMCHVSAHSVVVLGTSLIGSDTSESSARVVAADTSTALVPSEPD